MDRQGNVAMLTAIRCMGCDRLFMEGSPREVLNAYSAHARGCDLGLEQKKWREARIQVLNRDGNRCRNCGSTENLHVHHIQWKRDGGEDKLSNLITLCRSCHQKEHPFPLTKKRKHEWES